MTTLAAMALHPESPKGGHINAPQVTDSLVHRVCDHNGLGCQVLWRMAQLVPHVPLRRRTWLDQSKMSSVPWDLVTAISCGCLNRKEFEIYILRFIIVTCMLCFLDLLLSTFDRIVRV